MKFLSVIILFLVGSSCCHPECDEHRRGKVIPFEVPEEGGAGGITNSRDEHEDPCGEGGSGGGGGTGGEGGSEPIPCVATRECGTSGLVCRDGLCKP